MEEQKKTNQGFNSRKAKYILTTGYHVDRTLPHAGKESPADITQYLQSQINMQKHGCDIAVGDVFVYSHFQYGQM